MDFTLVIIISLLMFGLGCAVGLMAPVIAANIYQSISLMFEKEDAEEEEKNETKEDGQCSAA